MKENGIKGLVHCVRVCVPISVRVCNNFRVFVGQLRMRMKNI